MQKPSYRKTRPDSLREVALRARAGESFDPALREFLDEFYRHPRRHEAMIKDEPESVAPLQDAYLAAVAEHLSERWGVPCPRWVENESRFLRRPFFAGGLESLKAILLVESPAAFRRRMIFVGADVLSRPRQPAR